MAGQVDPSALVVLVGLALGGGFVFLASDDSSDVTGIELFVDGGAAQV